MNIEHERARQAYKEVDDFVTVKTALKEGTKTPGIPEEFKHAVLCTGSFLCTKGPMDDSLKEALQKLDKTEQWKNAVERHSEDVKKRGFSKYKTWAMKCPSMLQNCGLMQTAAFYQDKAEKVYGVLGRWLTADNRVPWPDDSAGSDLMNRLNQLGDHDVEAYRFATREAIAFMTWVKRAVSVKLADIAEGD